MSTKSITYEFRVTVTLPLSDDPHDPDFYTEAQATSQAHRIAMEKQLYKLLGKFGGDCDCEIMKYDVVDDAPLATVAKEADRG